MTIENAVREIIEAWAQDEKEHMPDCNKSDRRTLSHPCNCGLDKVRRVQAEKILAKNK